MTQATLLLAVLAWLGTPGRLEGPAAVLDESGKIPITTSSEEARRMYLEARDLFDKLHLNEANTKYREAVGADPEFALGWYGRAQSSQTAAEFFESLERAVSLADQASPAERHMILGLQAGATSDPEGQREHYEALVRDYPDDERAHFLLGGWYNGKQDFERAIEHYARAVEIAPAYSPAYNLLGYANRFLERYAESEKAFQRYIELLPEEPNPHDSYAELLMKTGRFEESIEAYRKALGIDPEFNPSRIGIGNNQIFLGQGEEARATFQEMYDRAPNDGLRRAALFWTAASYVHEGNRDEALETIERMSAIAKKSGDHVALSGDLVLTGDILRETGGDVAEALAKYREAVDVMEKAAAPAEVKDAARRNLLYNEALVALRRGELEQAKEKTAAFRAAVEPLGVTAEVQQVHELDGLTALAEGDSDRALAELARANQQDPRILWATAQAHRRAADPVRAREMEDKTAGFNQLNFAFAYVRGQAREALARS